MRVVIPVQDSQRHHLAHVPKVGNFFYKVCVLLAKQELVLPVLLVLKSNPHLDWVALVTQLDNLFLCIFVIWELTSFLGFCWRIGIAIFIWWHIGLIFAFVENDVGISPLLGFHLHHVLTDVIFLATKAF